MLRSLKELERYAVSATDGEVGTVVDFLLDDEPWTVRYLIVATSFLEGHRVLISPISFRQADWSTQRFHLALTKDKVKNSPSVNVDAPVSRQHERDSGLWGGEAGGDVHLRSASELRGYHIQGNDKAVGYVEDFIVDDETWEVRYLAIDTSNWWIGKKVLVAPAWAKSVSWEERKIYVDMSREAIKGSPEWNANAPVNREYEARLYDYYGRPVYWASGDRPQAPPPVPKGNHPA